jgi:hypothetical protein
MISPVLMSAVVAIIDFYAEGKSSRKNKKPNKNRVKSLVLCINKAVFVEFSSKTAFFLKYVTY